MKKQKKGVGWMKSGVLVLIVFLCQAVGYAEERQLVPVGQTVGVTLDMKGVTVVDTTDVEGYDGKRSAPARDAGLVSGDIIEEMNGRAVASAREFEEAIKEQEGKTVTLLVRHGEEMRESSLTPALSNADGQYRIGVWIKDAASGIGTVTYYDPKTREFGALGHGIADDVQGEPVRVKCGEILNAQIVSVQKGGRGQPGELVGVFCENREKLGTVVSNTETGLKGVLDDGAAFDTTTDAIPVARRDEVQEGAAEILANVEEGKIETFSVEIQKINKDEKNPKGLVIKVTDPRLLDRTGGIVQGMSGSPLIQNGKLAGAVTHVFVSDPTRGYGILMETMLAEENRD